MADDLMDVGRRLRSVVAVMRRLGLAELEVAIGSDRVSVRSEPPAPGPDAAVPVPQAEPVAEELPGHAVRNPVAGTYYLTPRPGADPYVREGGYVSEGQIVGLVEAMKVYNEVTADRSCRVLRVFVDNGDTVTVGQPLVLLDVDDQPVPQAV